MKISIRKFRTEKNWKINRKVCLSNTKYAFHYLRAILTVSKGKSLFRIFCVRLNFYARLFGSCYMEYTINP
jgi:hypothetical protein